MAVGVGSGVWVGVAARTRVAVGVGSGVWVGVAKGMDVAVGAGCGRRCGARGEREHEERQGKEGERSQVGGASGGGVIGV